MLRLKPVGMQKIVFLVFGGTVGDENPRIELGDDEGTDLSFYSSKASQMTSRNLPSAILRCFCSGNFTFLLHLKTRSMGGWVRGDYEFMKPLRRKTFLASSVFSTLMNRENWKASLGIAVLSVTSSSIPSTLSCRMPMTQLTFVDAKRFTKLIQLFLDWHRNTSRWLTLFTKLPRCHRLIAMKLARVISWLVSSHSSAIKSWKVDWTNPET